MLRSQSIMKEVTACILLGLAAFPLTPKDMADEFKELDIDTDGESKNWISAIMDVKHHEVLW